MSKIKIFTILITVFLLGTIMIGCDLCDPKVKILSVSFDTIKSSCKPPFITTFRAKIETQNTSESNVKYSWNFGDTTSISNEKDALHSFAKNGLYTVVLTASYKNAQDRKSLIIDLRNNLPINPKFQVQFAENNYYVPAEVKFINKTERASDYFWNFGDGSGVKEFSPTHKFTKAGIFNVILNAICSGDTAKYSIPIEVHAAPTEIIVKSMKVSLTQEFLHKNLYSEVHFDGHHEGESEVIKDVKEFPTSFIFDRELFFFNGDFSQGILSFEIYDLDSRFEPIWEFQFSVSELRDKHYPESITKNDSQRGFSATIFFEYKSNAK